MRPFTYQVAVRFSVQAFAKTANLFKTKIPMMKWRSFAKLDCDLRRRRPEPPAHEAPRYKIKELRIAIYDCRLQSTKNMRCFLYSRASS